MLPEDGQNLADTIQSVIDRVHANRASAEQDKHGIRVEVLKAIERPISPGSHETYEVRVHTTDPEVKARDALQEATLMQQGSHRHLSPFQLIEPLERRNDRSFDLRVTCSPTTPGVNRTVLALKFANAASDNRLFAISRFIEVRCGDNEILDDLRPTAPFQRRRRNRRQPNSKFLPGEPLPHNGELPPWPTAMLPTAARPLLAGLGPSS